MFGWFPNQEKKDPARESKEKGLLYSELNNEAFQLASRIWRKYLFTEKLSMLIDLPLAILGSTKNLNTEVLQGEANLPPPVIF